MTDPSPQSSGARTALVTGATGYIGGALVPQMLDAGWSVRVLCRDASALADRPWRAGVEVVEGDASSEDDLRRAMEGIRTAYFLIHSMGGSTDFADRDRALAHTFGSVASESGVRRIVYLGGLHPADEELSPHLASRVEVGRILLASGVPTVVLQAAVVVGNGSASFAMLRYLAGRLPVMVAPKWLRNRIQPIAIDDVLRYLVGCADLPDDVNRTFDIGGDEVMTYEDMLRRFAELTGLRRRIIITVPVLTPTLASHWVGVVTPLDAAATSASAITRLERADRTEEASAYRLELAANLALNTAWSALFWRAKRPWVAALEAAALIVSSARLSKRAGVVSPTLGKTLAPYALWCGFATALSAEITRRNR